MLKLNRSVMGVLMLVCLAASCGGTGKGRGAGPTDGGSGGNGGQPGSVLTPPPPGGVIPSTAIACTAAADAGLFTFGSVPVWRDDAVAAYVMIHDDACGSALRGIDQLAVPAMAMRGVNAAVGPYVEACQDGSLWGILSDAEGKGNEIINHSYTHPNITMANAMHEVVESKAVFDTKVKNKVSFYIFPFDFFTPATIQAVASAGHIGARAGSRDPFDGFETLPLNPATAPATGPGADMELVFDVWPRTYSKYALYRPEDVLDIHVWNAIDAWENPPSMGTPPVAQAKRQVFAVREMHSVSPLANPPEDGTQGFGPVPIRTYEKHLDFLVAAWKANKVWTTTPSTAIRYRHARTACLPRIGESNLIYNTSAADCQKFATPISTIVKSGNDVPGLSAVQAGKPVSVRKLGPNTFSVTADPLAGPVTLGGCSMASVGIDSAALASFKKPTPANSVCDLLQVKGKGMPGLMDNLERTTDMLAVLPNPAQGDGRDGSWSFYPGSATVEIIKDPAGTNATSVLRYAGQALGGYSGVTLAFLGGNGAGSCYDASAYQGVRFKIKGHDTATDVYNGKTYLSLVTAETQTRKYGGDHVGDSGHFHIPVTLTADWQTVSVTWTQFMPPTFGQAPLPTTLALTKLQALDFGVSSATSDFEIFLDDIELF